MTEKALVKPATEPYDEIMPESTWGDWTRHNLIYYTKYYGYTLIEDYESTEELPTL